METQVKLFREKEHALAVDGGLNVFQFSEISGKLRGPTLPIRPLPAPKPSAKSHVDSGDFEPFQISVTFKPTKVGFYRSLFLLEYSGERKIHFACEGCASKEEADELRISPGLFSALKNN